MPKRSTSSSTSSSRKSRRPSAPTDDNDDNDRILGLSGRQSQNIVQFSQQIPDTNTEQPAANIRESERAHFSELLKPQQQKLISLLSRHILFKAFAGEPLDRVKLTKEAWEGQKLDCRVSNVALAEACQRIKDVWGVEVRRIPQFMESIKSLPNKYKDRLYVVNNVRDDDRGSHSKVLHGVHLDEAVEKGLLMLVLSFVYCKGELTDGMRWLSVRILYRLLHSVDEFIPSEPPSSETSGGKRSRRASTEGGTPRSARRRSNVDAGGVALIPNVDEILEKFVLMDYLLKKKVEQAPGEGQVVEDSDRLFYAMGPRAALEVGRKQIICFCAEILDEQPDITMLTEIENDGNGEEAVGDEDNGAENIGR